MPPTGRIPPNSGGWHRDLFSGSVAGALTSRPLLILATDYTTNADIANSTKVPVILHYNLTVTPKPKQELTLRRDSGESSSQVGHDRALLADRGGRFEESVLQVRGFRCAKRYRETAFSGRTADQAERRPSIAQRSERFFYLRSKPTSRSRILFLSSALRARPS